MTAVEQVASLKIHIADVFAGELVLKANDTTEFRLSESYREAARRPVLGQIFEEDLKRVHSSRMRLPPFFSNLLPEGRLRELVAERLNASVDREYFLLSHLGEDLPGAVRATPTGELERLLRYERSSGVESDATAPLKFSLAGVQLKLSMIRSGRGMTLPAGGRGGDWIVKLPGTTFQGVPENEFSIMSWARRVGLQVPETLLVQVAELEGLPEGLGDQGERMAYAVRRFDRPGDGRRIHVEDFAQVRNVYPHAKYRSTNYETIAKILLRVAGREAFEELVRRLAFLVVTANADAHVKNWALMYPDGLSATLSPAYDLVATIEFIERDELALNLGRTKAFEEVSYTRFATFAERVGADPASVVPVVSGVVERSLDMWSEVKRDLPVSPLLVQRLEQHWRRLPLVTTPPRR